VAFKPEQGTKACAIPEYGTNIFVIVMQAAENYLPTIRGP